MESWSSRMASFLPCDRNAEAANPPLTLTALQVFVGGFIKFVELSSGDLLVVNEVQTFAPLNQTASRLAGTPIYGHAVICLPEEIA